MTAMSLWVKFRIWFSTAILVAVSCGIVLLPAPMAHAAKNSAVEFGTHATMENSASVDHQHASMADANTSANLVDQSHNHEDGQCCSGLCLPIALIDFQTLIAPVQASVPNGIAPAQLASIDSLGALRPPLT